MNRVNGTKGLMGRMGLIDGVNVDDAFTDGNGRAICFVANCIKTAPFYCYNAQLLGDLLTKL